MISEPLLKRKCNVLILGLGFIGTGLSVSLVFDECFNVKIANREFLDYHDKTVLKKYLFENKIDAVINTSGFTGRPNVDEAEVKKELCWHLNVTVPLMVCRVCNELGVKYLHISSGCIYDGYSKIFTEDDKPNFGLFDYSSFYSKTKHAFELMSKDLNSKILRIRMPLALNGSRDFLTKIKNYDNLISFRNSKTSVRDLENFIITMLKIDNDEFWWERGQDIYNVVNSDPLTTEEIMEVMKKFNWYNPNWKIVNEWDLNLSAPRSNCVLCNEKANMIYKMSSEMDIVEEIASEKEFAERYKL